MVSRKHYIRIANALHEAMPSINDAAAYEQWQRDVNTISYALVGTNPLFDRQRFKTACYGEK